MSLAMAVTCHNIISYLDEASVADMSQEVWGALLKHLVLGHGPFHESVSCVMEN